MTKSQQILQARGIEETPEIIELMKYCLNVGYSTSVMGMSATTLEDLHKE
jgi:hypothetical protein